MTSIDFCIPVKNEEKILETNMLRLLRFLKEKNLDYSWQIVIVINGSNDNSKKIAAKLEKRNSNFFKLKCIEKGGKGFALRQYFNESKADILVFMDADLSASLDYIQTLLDALLYKDFDISIGSRLLPNSITHRSLFRELASRLYNSFSRFVLKHTFSDLQCGFKAFKKEVVIKVFPTLKEDTFFFDTECILMSKKNGYKIKEIPIDWQENRYFKRKTKISFIFDGLYFVKKTILLKKQL